MIVKRQSPPKAKQKGGRFVCPDPDCGRDFKNEHGYHMHYWKMHDNLFRKGLKASTTAELDEIYEEDSLPDILRIARAVLKSHGGSVSRTDLARGIIEQGYTGGSGSEKAVATYLSNRVRKFPNAGIYQPKRGHYSLKSVRTRTQRQNSPHSPQIEKTQEETVSPEVELEILRRENEQLRSKLQRRTEMLMLSLSEG